MCLTLTIALETGDIGRFPSAGHFASYARMVESRRGIQRQEQGTANARCRNKHLSWAFIEAAHFAVRYDPTVKRFCGRKCSKALAVVALEAVAHKLARV